MLIDELKEKIKSTEPEIKVIQTFWQNSNLDKEIERLQKLSEQENVWQDPKQIENLKELQRLKNLKENYSDILKSQNDLTELVSLFENDEQELSKLKDEIYSWARIVHRFKINILLDEEDDKSNCFLSINSGAGGTESQDWAEILLRMYIRFCERENFNVQIIDYQPGEGAGIKSATLFIKGKNSYGFLKNEEGIHRLVRISPFDASKRRHTSFAGVTATPESQDAKIIINPDDLRIDTYRAGGAGGQHVNKTDSAVRITHIPTGIVVQCQNERSQLQNKETAMKMLMAKLIQKQKEEKKAKEESKERKKIEWGSQIRSYVLHPYKMVKDHRTEIESPQPENVLDGDIMDFIEANLVQLKSV